MARNEPVYACYINGTIGVAHWFSATNLAQGQGVDHHVEAGTLRPYIDPSRQRPHRTLLSVESSDASSAYYVDDAPRDVGVIHVDPESDFAVSGRSQFRLVAGRKTPAIVTLTSRAELLGSDLEVSGDMSVS